MVVTHDVSLEALGFDFVIMEDLSRCVAIAVEASGVENEAMQLDRCGPENGAAAAAAYRRAAHLLVEAAAECPEDHPDKSVLEDHAREVIMRADYLEGLEGAPASVPLEDHIHAVTLTIGSPPCMDSCSPLNKQDRQLRCRPASDETKVMGAAAAVAAGTGLLLMGPISAVALGVGAAYASTREDQAGLAVRKVGKAGVKAVHHARTIDETYRISNKALTAGQSAIEQVMVVGAKYGLAETAKETTRAIRGLHSFNERHKVTSTLGRGLFSAGSALTGFVNKDASATR